MLLGCHCAEIIPIEPDMVIHVRKMTKSIPIFFYKIKYTHENIYNCDIVFS